MKLLRPGKTNLKRGASYLALTCCSTNIVTAPNSHRITKGDNARWVVECEECGAVMSLNDVLLLKEEDS